MPYKTKTSVSSDTEKRFYVWLLLIILILAAGLWFYSARKPSAKPEAEGKTAGDLVLNVLPLQRQDVEVSSRYIGYVTPIKSVNVVPNVSGYLDKIWVQGGQDVKAGDNLLLIEQSEYKARLDAAKASVAQAQADLNNAAIYYKRMQKAGAKAVSKTELDNAKAEAQKYVAEAQKQQADILRDAAKMKSQIIEEAKAAAQEEAKKVMDAAKLAIEQARKESELQFRNEVSSFALSIAEKMIKKNMEGDKAQAELVNKLLNEVENKN